MKRVTTLILIAMIVIGCAGYGYNTSTPTKGSLFSGSGKCGKYTPESSMSGFMSEDFPQTRVSITFNLEFKPDMSQDELERFQDSRSAISHWGILYLADRKMADFKGSANLQKIADDMEKGLNDIIWPGGNGKIAKVYFQNISFTREKSLAEIPASAR